MEKPSKGIKTQYLEKRFKKCFGLISCLLVAEQNNELWMKNHESRPTTSAPFPEASATSILGKNNIMPTIVVKEVVANTDMIEIEVEKVLSRTYISTRSGTIKMVTNKRKINKFSHDQVTT
ncbi:uncharacterized protein [Spinacia oleracea]|uniref:Uncharacterized protein n=1 Tax=Spinacia oleracea TaxID=3562 RepID=A0ABM3RE99_SPIOL|nr:uncharacterized protein LOC130468916 [Spinacia oleracea]